MLSKIEKSIAWSVEIVIVGFTICAAMVGANAWALVFLATIYTVFLLILLCVEKQ